MTTVGQALARSVRHGTDSDTFQHHLDHHNTISEAGTSLCSQQKDETAIIIHDLTDESQSMPKVAKLVLEAMLPGLAPSLIPPHPLLRGDRPAPCRRDGAFKTEGSGLPPHSDFPLLHLLLLEESSIREEAKKGLLELRNACTRGMIKTWNTQRALLIAF